MYFFYFKLTPPLHLTVQNRLAWKNNNNRRFCFSLADGGGRTNSGGGSLYSYIEIGRPNISINEIVRYNRIKGSPACVYFLNKMLLFFTVMLRFHDDNCCMYARKIKEIFHCFRFLKNK